MIKPFLNRIHHGDCCEIMSRMPSESVDLIVTSPPYNLLTTTGGGIEWRKSKQPKNNRGVPVGRHPMTEGYEGYGDNMPNDEYAAWQRQCLDAMMRLLTPDGAIFYVHKWRVQDGLIQDRQDIVEKFPVRQIIIWHQGVGINKNPGYFLPAYEVVYLIAKPDFKLAHRANELGNVWYIPRTRKETEHPCPFPLQLAQACVNSTDAKVVLDPFIGSGTTAVAAAQANRDWIGIELSETYVDMARNRIEIETAQLSLL